ncbi:hypothetical protein [uncultured Dokdonia sp.]|uniref:hypothetical protein n=1 Tax=uncultured Dokdonia sp. TaxID=575653 RepID=UPI0026333CB1|nr:hypothetical protein [uncultured Dokdonia sp.]
MKHLQKCIYLFLVLITASIHAQQTPTNNTTTKTLKLTSDGSIENIDDVYFDANKLVSNFSFTELVFRDLNYLIVGENTPNQGFDYSLSNDKSTITLSGAIPKVFNKFLLTVDGEFTSDDGVYFFDNDNGSTSATLTTNIFIPFGGGRKYNSIKNEHVQLAILQNELEKRAIIEKVIKEYKTALAKMKFLKLPVSIADTIDEKRVKKRNHLYIYEKFEKTIKEKFGYHIDDSSLAINLSQKYGTDVSNTSNITYLKKDSIVEIDSIIPSRSKTKITTTQVPVFKKDDKDMAEQIAYAVTETKATSKLNALKVIQEFKASLVQLDSIETALKTKEIEVAQKLWNTKKAHFIGISPFYKRESLPIYEFNETTSLSDNLERVRGDVYGATISYNYFRQSGVPDSFFRRVYFRVSNTLERTSNFSDFTSQDFQVILPTGDMIGDSPITTTQNITGYTNANGIDYDYGFSIAGQAEVYLYPYNDYVGVFGVVGYRKRFGIEGEISDRTERYNLRLGTLFNLKNKSKKTNLLTLQIFADRSDLSKSPDGSDQNLRFGFNVGLPVNFSSQL